jgi:hypothetical protein
MPSMTEPVEGSERWTIRWWRQEPTTKLRSAIGGELAHPQVGPGMITCGLVDLFLVRCYRRFY